MMPQANCRYLAICLCCLVLSWNYSICNTQGFQQKQDENYSSRLSADAIKSSVRHLRDLSGNTFGSGNNNNIDYEQFRINEPNDLNRSSTADHGGGKCKLIPIVHLLNHPGCQLKAISSYACSGACHSYVQAASSKLWQHERSCSCCQQTGSREATFTLDCPSLDPPYRKVKTFAPVDCMCRSCTDIQHEELRPQELVEALAGEVSDGSNVGLVSSSGKIRH